MALSPYCAPFVEAKTLGALGVPVMYQGGTNDIGITPSVKRKGGAFDQTSSPSVFVEFTGAGHFAWTDLNKRFHAPSTECCVAFFDRFLKGHSSIDPAKRPSQFADLRSR